MEEHITSDYLERRDTTLASVLNSLFDGVYVTDLQRRILFWNRGAEEITGYSSDEVAGHRCSDNILNHIDENGRPLCRGRCPLLQCMTTGQEVRSKIYPLHKSGRRFPVMTHIAPLRDASGKIIAGIEVFRDISQEEEFRLLQEKFNALVQRYVSRSTYEEIMAEAKGTEGDAQIRDLTVFYLDIVGFTAISEKTPPVEIVTMLNSVFGICDVITREKHGDIDKFIGDAIMAVFIDANDAVEAAAMVQQEALPAYNAQRFEQGFEPIRVRIGINSGMVVQGTIGTSDRKDLTVIGDVVNTAQRIETACEPGLVYISEATLSRLNPTNTKRFEPAGETTVKGKQDPLRLYRSLSS